MVDVPGSNPPKRLATIEALRGLAATAVVLSHVARHLDHATPIPTIRALLEPGHAGVDLFFVLSGFIILWVHGADIDTPGRLGHYARRRFDRVMPLYWVGLALTIGLSSAGHALPDAFSVLWWAALLPTSGELIYGIAWSLQYEALFYVCFALLILNRRLGVLALSAWLLVILINLREPAPTGLWKSYGLEFLFGMAAAHLLRTVRIPRPGTLAGLGAGMFAAAYAAEAEGLLDGFSALARIAYGLPAAVVILALAAAERSAGLRAPRWTVVLGGASYSIYLFQFVFIGVAWQALSRAGLAAVLPTPILLLGLAATSVLGGIAVSLMVERPLLAALHRRVLPARRAIA